ncbi:MAG: ABC transporter permease [Acidimicrobiia bacterium]|nr:ABC transporter permease [Acidimicrobiia bacterium]
MKSFTIAAVNLKRFVRDRSNVFFVFIFPMLLILVLGSAFGGDFQARLGVIAESEDPLAQDLVTRLQAIETVAVVEADSAEGALRSVERGELEAAVIIPADYDEAIGSGRTVSVEFLARSAQEASSLRSNVESAITQQAVVLRAARFAESEGLATFDAALSTATATEGFIGDVSVDVVAVGEAFALDELGQFDSSAQTQLLLFVFLTSLAGSSALIQTRRLGVARRMIATPTQVRNVLVGEGLGRFAVALVQGLFIMIGTWLIFGVDWGDPILATVILLLFSLVGSGAAMLMGAVFSNDEQAGGMGVLLGLGLAALGGCMMPLQVFELIAPGLYTVAHITPHAWGLEAFDSIVLSNGTFTDIAVFLLILVGYAVVFYALAIWRLRVVLTR